MTFKSRVVTTILAIVMPVLVGIALLSYWHVMMHFEASREQVEQNVQNLIEVTNEAYEIVERSLAEEMERALEKMRTAFLEAGGSPGEMNLERLKQQFDDRMDIYLISPDDIVEYTTYSLDSGLNLGQTDDGQQLLDRVRDSDKPFIQRMSRETRSGRLRKYGYLPAPDSDWVLEVGVTTTTIESQLSSLDPLPLSERLVKVNPIVIDARILDRDGWQVSVNDPVPPSDDLREQVQKAARQEQALEVRQGNEVRRYLHVGPDVPVYSEEYAFGVITTVVELTYSTTQLTTGGAIIAVILLGTLAIILLLTTRAAGRISQPVSLLEREFARAANGDLTAHAQIESDDELGAAARSFNIMMERIRELTYYDPVTGLPNRGVFREYFDAHISGSSATGADPDSPRRPRAILAMVAPDRFREINQRFGYQTGSLLLKTAADRVRERIGLKANIYRGQSDEFLLLFEGDRTRQPVLRELKLLMPSLGEPYRVAQQDISLSFSVGVAEYPQHGSTLDDLIRNAGFARDLASSRGPGEIRVFDPDQHTRFVEYRQMEDRMRAAIENDEFYFHYQPIFDLDKRHMVSAETLLRWGHPDRGNIAPDEFIPVAERSSLIVRIGRQALWSSCEACRRWTASDTRIAVNVAARHFESPSFVRDIRNILNDTGVAPNRLELELTERTVLTDVETSIERLTELRKQGISVAIDDFGTGYSSLGYLARLPVDTVKIDRSFIGMIEESKQARAIVSSIVAIGHALDVNLVAEGVETKAQLDFVREAGCQSAQGFGLATPASFSAIADPALVRPAM